MLINRTSTAALTFEDRDALARIRKDVADQECESLDDATQLALWDAWQAGDEDARTTIWMSWRRYALRAAIAMARYTSLKDAWQVVQLALWEAMEGWNPRAGRALGPWSELIMRRRLREHAADEAAISLPERHVHTHKIDVYTIDERDAEAAQVYDDGMPGAVRRAIQRLPHQHRIAIQRACGISSSEEPTSAIAAELGIGYAAVNSLINEARQMLACDPAVQAFAADIGIDADPLNAFKADEQFTFFDSILMGVRAGP